jgi:hypothetical protein
MPCQIINYRRILGCTVCTVLLYFYALEQVLGVVRSSCRTCSNYCTQLCRRQVQDRYLVEIDEVLSITRPRPYSFLGQVQYSTVLCCTTVIYCEPSPNVRLRTFVVGFASRMKVKSGGSTLTYLHNTLHSFLHPKVTQHLLAIHSGLPL